MCAFLTKEGPPVVLGPGEPGEARQDCHDHAVEGGRREYQAVRPAESQVHKDEERKEHCNLVYLQQIQRNPVKTRSMDTTCHGSTAGP